MCDQVKELEKVTIILKAVNAPILNQNNVNAKRNMNFFRLNQQIKKLLVKAGAI